MAIIRKGTGTSVAQPPTPPTAAELRTALELGSSSTIDASEFAQATHSHIASEITNLDSHPIENRTSDPGAPVSGQLWLRTDL